MPETITTNLLKANYLLRKGLDRQQATDLWHVQGVEALTPAEAEAKFVDSVPITLGALHRSLAAAVCVDKSLVSFWPQSGTSPQTWSAYVTVAYDTFRVSFGGTRLSSGSSSDFIEFGVPIWTQMASGVGGSPDLYRRTVRIVPRAKITVFKQSFITAANADAATINIADNAGKGYTIPGVLGGRPVILDPRSQVRTAGGSGFVQYVFTTYGRVKAHPAGTFDDQDVSLPALNFLEEYDEDSESNPPDVGKKDLSDLYEPGDALLFL